MIIGTAGHIDHGKTALVQALTGKAMDPFIDERRRGITLDLHVASLALPDGRVTGVVDVPGHEDLVRTMVAGAAGLDLVLLVIAADDGIMPQSREHLAVVEQLRVPFGIPVLTRADLVDPDWLALVQADVEAWLRDSPVRFGPVAVTSAVTGLGIDALRMQIATCEAGRNRTIGDLSRLPVDRVLSLPGTGTVVTGTSWTGEWQTDEAVLVLPAGHEARIRSIERHGGAVQVTAPGERIALALAGVDRAQVRRGDTIVRPGEGWEVTSVIDAMLGLLSSAPHPLTHQTRVRVHLATFETMARIHLRESIPPGGAGLARLVLESPAVARGGDRLVLRSYSPVTTVGGGWVVDPQPPRQRAEWVPALAHESPADRLVALVDRRPDGLSMLSAPVVLGVSPRELVRLLRAAPVTRYHDLLLTPGRIGEAQHFAVARVEAWHREHPAAPGMPRQTLRQALDRFRGVAEVALERVLTSGKLVASAAVVTTPGFQAGVAGGATVLDQLVDQIEKAGLMPPSAGELKLESGGDAVADALRLAARAGRLVQVEPDRYYSPVAIATFSAALRELAPKGITPAALRERTGLSRKFLIPLLEWADASGLTIRRGDSRIPGPRLGIPAPT
ncbi:MAG: selenocysteine-specific translation elongation factor [Gemmatimonadales bacterium]